MNLLSLILSTDSQTKEDSIVAILFFGGYQILLSKYGCTVLGITPSTNSFCKPVSILPSSFNEMRN